jgi:SMI1/KNR4 family protein SUKH-1
MADNLKTVGLIVVLLVVLPVLILSLRDIFRHGSRRMTAEERETTRTKWIERLRHPQFDELEKICGGAIPKQLRLAYEQSDMVLARNLEFAPPGKDPKKHSYWIAEFVPCDAHGQKYTTDLSEFGRGCCFAGDGMGNFYWTPVSDTAQDDAPVYFACHDPYGNEKVAESLEEFFGWLREGRAER